MKLKILFIVSALAVICPTLSRGEEPLFDKTHMTFKSYMDVGYDQALRPQFHFSSRKNWINDPNGMVYYDGEWHLFFQHCALGVDRGARSWGHAVSKDMVHWKQLPHAILPYSGGTIWSGSAVVDHNNSLGKQVGKTKTIVAFFTKTQSKPKHFIQAAAYSIDRGRTFKLVNNGKAVLPNQRVSHSERDPKVFWDEASKKWVMVIILGGWSKPTRFFTSDNLVDWKKSGDIRRSWTKECVDIFRLPVDGDNNKMKWVMADASYDYEVGEFNGKIFTATGDTLQGDFGTKHFYAAQTFNNGPDGRVCQMGWLRDRRKECPFLVEKMPFTQQLSFPCELSLRTTPEGIRLIRWPVKEIESLYKDSHKAKKLSLKTANKFLAKIHPELIDLSIEFEPGDNKTVKLNIRGLDIVYGNIKQYKTRKGKVIKVKSVAYGDCMVPAPMNDGKVRLRVLVDRSSVELFVNDGAFVGTSYAFPAAANRDISISAASDVKINELIVNELKTSWK